MHSSVGSSTGLLNGKRFITEPTEQVQYLLRNCQHLTKWVITLTDRQWLLNIDAVRAAQLCARCIEEEFNVRMPLARTDFLAKVQLYADQSSSIRLKNAVSTLHERIYGAEPLVTDEQDMLVYMGKTYPRWRDGKIFSGVYRGAPVYSEHRTS
ncbi:hypothetical protein ACFOSD_07360 [Salinispirillum marinum]|uniref:Uncharacterized protein n=2 Tax=Saccharospirillaceae TaxID=255527 RepID=A0ABV8BFM4_9GAMM